MNIFHELLYQPLYNILILFYNLSPGKDFGLAIIFFTILLRLILAPLYKKQIESQKKLQAFQPQIKQIQEKYKNNKEKQTREIMDFYKKNKVNPFAGCFPLIIQLAFLFAIFQVIDKISKSDFVVNGDELYFFVNNPGSINHLFLGLVDLARPSPVLAVLSAIAQFFQTKMLLGKKKDISYGMDKKADFTQIMNKQMLFLGPLLTFYIGIKFAAGLALYWLVSTLFMIVQQELMDRKAKESKQGK